LLAYVFWHQPGDEVDPGSYEEGLCAFHGGLDLDSASFRLKRFPFRAGGGYEDWYLVESWSELEDLNDRAVDAHHRASHDRVAAGTARGWGGIYELVRGEARIPTGTEWFDKPLGEPTADFLATRPEGTIWRRQLVLGPAPEFCASVAATPTRIAL
jgi:hypothetical protein